MDFRKAIKRRWCGIGATKFVVELRFQLFLVAVMRGWLIFNL